MGEGKNQHCRSDDHELHAGAGGRDEIAQPMVDIAHARLVSKGDAAQGFHPAGGGAQNPPQALRVRLTVEIFHSQEDKESCHMKYVRDDEIKAAFITMINKLIYGYRLILTPYLKVLENSSGDEAIQRIQHLEQLIAQNSEQRDALTS